MTVDIKCLKELLREKIEIDKQAAVLKEKAEFFNKSLTACMGRPSGATISHNDVLEVLISDEEGIPHDQV